MIQVFAHSCTIKLRGPKLCLQNLMFILYSNVLVSYLCCQSVSSVAQLCSTFVTPWTVAYQASLSITNSCSLLKLMSIESVMPSNSFILFIPFSICLQSFPPSGSFPMSQLFASCGQSTGVSASASVLPMNIQKEYYFL